MMGVLKNSGDIFQTDEIFFQNEFKYFDSHIDLANYDCVEELFFQICDYNSLKNYKPYNPILKAKGSGIIPYAFNNGQIYFLLQKQISPLKRKDSGWVDFGGKKDNNESTILTATREFSEETSCLFYLKELENTDPELYAKLKDNSELKYSDETVNELLNLIPKSEQYFYDKINAFVDPIYVSSKETYISYLLKVNYIPAEDLPRAEDIHIPYEDRYIRKCKWFSLGELMLLEEYNLHKRLQITKMKNRIKNYYDKGLLD